MRFVAKGGYVAQIDAIKVYGIFGGYDKKFTIGTSDSITAGLIGKIIILLLITEFVLMMFNYFKFVGKTKRIVMIADLVMLSIQSILVTYVVVSNNWISRGNAVYESIRLFKTMEISAQSILITCVIWIIVTIVTFLC